MSQAPLTQDQVTLLFEKPDKFFEREAKQIIRTGEWNTDKDVLGARIELFLREGKNLLDAVTMAFPFDLAWSEQKRPDNVDAMALIHEAKFDPGTRVIGDKTKLPTASSIDAGAP